MAHVPRGPKLRVEVSDEIIATSLSGGGARDSSHCMIAEAIRRARPDVKAISVDLATVRFTDRKRGLRYTYLTPRVAQVQLVNFDQGRKPEPFAFQLRGAHVTRSGKAKSENKSDKALTEKERLQRKAAGERLSRSLRRTKIVDRYKSKGVVPERIGGTTPPLQRGADSLPFSRRRAFGLRGLEY